MRSFDDIKNGDIIQYLSRTGPDSFVWAKNPENRSMNNDIIIRNEEIFTIVNLKTDKFNYVDILYNGQLCQIKLQFFDYRDVIGKGLFRIIK